MIINLVTGRPHVATITVNCPTQSTVVCSLGQFSYTKKSGSSKSVSFEVPISGTWTVTITWGGQTYTTTVSATSQGTVLNAKFRYYIFKSGEGLKVNASYYNGSNAVRLISGTKSFDVAYNTSGIREKVLTDAKIDLSGFSKFVVDATHHDNDHKLWMLAQSSTSGTTTINKFSCPTRTTVTYTFSNLKSSHIGLYNGSSWGATFYNWYLEV